MGNVAGALGRAVVKKARRFNVESRTERFLDKNVKTPAPKPVATQREIEQITQEMPDLMEKIHMRNEELLNRLKNVYVSSEDKPLDRIKTDVNPNRPLPLQRKSELLEYGYVEPETVSPGKITLKQALQLLSKHQLDKETNNIKSLAAEYNLSEKDVANFVDYFKVYTLVETNSKEKGSDPNPYTILKDPIDNVKISIMNFPEKKREFEAAVKKKTDADNKRALESSEKNSKNN